MTRSEVRFALVMVTLLIFSCKRAGVDSNLFDDGHSKDEFKIYTEKVDPQKANQKLLHPRIVMFPGGKDFQQKNVQAAIDRLQSYRPASKLYPPAKNDLGLSVVLLGMRFLRNAVSKTETQYLIQLLGEFNAYQVEANAAQMKKVFDGELTRLEFSATSDYVLFLPTVKLSLEMKVDKGDLCISSLRAQFAFSERVFRNLRIAFDEYKSSEVSHAKAKDQECLYYGTRAALPDLKVLNAN